MEKLFPSPALAEHLESRLPEIQESWVRMLRDLPSQRYREITDGDLSSWTAAALEAVVESLRQGSKRPLVAHASDVIGIRRFRQLSINEVVEGLLLMREAAHDHLGVDASDQATSSGEPARRFDTALRVLIARLAELFATAMNRSIREERDRSSVLLDVMGAAGESLDLTVVMPTVAQSIKDALDFSFCSIYLWNESAGTFSACAKAGELGDSRVMTLLEQDIEPETNAFAAQALAAEGISTWRSFSEHRFGAESLEQLGISAAVVLPIRLANRLLAFALALQTAPDATFDSQALVLASAIATSVAPAVDNARHHTETRQQLSGSQKLQRAMESFLEMQGLEDVVAIICREAEKLTGAIGSAVLLGEEGAVSATSLKRGSASGRNEEELLAPPLEGRSRIVLPLEVRGHRLGHLVLLSGESGFREETPSVAPGFSQQAAVAVQHAVLHRQHEQLAALKERQRLAQDLHDSVTQSIYGVTMYGEAAVRHLESDQVDRALAVLEVLRETAQDALREMRLMVFELRPSVLESEGLVAALENRLAAVEARADLLTDLTVESEVSLPPRVSEAVYGIAKEALNNVLKHAAASRVHVRLGGGPSELIVEISDDGVGFERAEVERDGGLGLTGMEERAMAVGARLEVVSTPGEGTTVGVVMPLASIGHASSAEEEKP